MIVSLKHVDSIKLSKTILDEEHMVLKIVRRDMMYCKDVNSINKLYRQARIWTRFHHDMAHACTKEMATWLNKRFDSFRIEATGALK